MQGISKFLKKKYGELIFGLFCGISYFFIVARFIVSNSNFGVLLAFFFFPAIVCLGAIFVIKLLRDLISKEKYSAVNLFMWLHMLLFIISCVTAADMIL